MTRCPILLLCCVAAGCSTPPLAIASAPPIASPAWSAAGTSDGAPRADAPFWTRFGSPDLARIVAAAARDNSQVAAAQARVLRARAQAGLARSALLPTVGLSAGAAQVAASGFNTSRYTNSAGQLGIDVAYDVDLFGGARAVHGAALARSDAARFDAGATALVVETDAARTFVAIAATDDRLRLVDRLLGNARALARIVAIRRREGVAAETDERLQAVEISRLAAHRAELAQARTTLTGALAVLIGRESPAFTLPPLALGDLAAPAIDPGQPGDLVFRRPDVLAAEARIAAANGDVRAARAAFLPSLSLSAGALGQALTTSGPFGATLRLAGGMFAPIFQGGRLRANYASVRADQMEAVALYRQRLLEALQEGNAALAAVAGAGEQEDALRGGVSAARRGVALARERYAAGAADIGLVLDAERGEIAVEESLLDAQLARRIAAIDLFKALGGAPRQP